MPKSVSFNLVSDPWITVEMVDGDSKNVSLLELFNEAHLIRRITGEFPQMRIALIRLVLAIMYRAYGDPAFQDASGDDLREAWESLWKSERFEDGVVEEYLECWHDHFDLFGDHPFYQVPGLEYVKGGFDGVDLIMPDIPNMGKALFSMKSLHHKDVLSFDEAARYLVTSFCFDVAGIKTPVVGNTHVNNGKVYAPKGLPGTGWCGMLGGVFLEGKTLKDTLMLNWVLFEQGSKRTCLLGLPGDTPCWELDEKQSDLCVCEPKGPAQLLSWQSRRVRLVTTEDGEAVYGVISCYGDIASPVDKNFIEMMTPWRESATQQKKLGLSYVPLMPKKHDPDRVIWRGLNAMIAYDQKNLSQADLRPGVIRWAEYLICSQKRLLDVDYPIIICTQGIEYGTQDSVYSDGVDDSIQTNALMLVTDEEASHEALDVIARTEESVNNLVRLVLDVQAAMGDKRQVKRDDGKRLSQDIRDQAYELLDEIFRRRLSELTSTVDALTFCAEWRVEVFQTLLNLGAQYVEKSGASYFMSGENGSVGSALLRFRALTSSTLRISNMSSTMGNSGTKESDRR